MRQVTRKGLMTVAAATGVLAATGGYAHADSTAQGHTARSPGVLSGNSVQVPVEVPVNVCGNTVDVAGLLNPSVGNHCGNTGDAHEHGRPGQHGRTAAGQHGHTAGQHGHTAGQPHGHAGGGQEHGHGYGHGPQGSGRPGQAPYTAHSGGGAKADGFAGGSPGILSGNTLQVPLDVPVNVCGNSVDIIGIANPAVGNDCVNHGGGRHHTPPRQTPPGPGRPTPPPAVPGQPDQPDQPDEPEQPRTPPTPAPPAGHVTHPVNPPRLAETGSDTPLGTVVPLAAGALLAGGILYRRARLSA